MKSPIILFEDISRQYKMGSDIIYALKDVNIRIQKGEYVAFMGPSGSGKSTLMNIVGCLDTPTRGRYVLNGQEVSGMSEKELAMVRNKEIGFIFQTFNLLSRSTALENVALPLIYSGVSRRFRIEKALFMLSQVGLSDRAYHRPNELSGGQRQRVAVARALINSPSILLADEPTGNLDTKTSEEIMALFAQLIEQGNTIAMVTHDSMVAAHAGRTVVLQDGTIVSDATATVHH